MGIYDLERKRPNGNELSHNYSYTFAALTA